MRVLIERVERGLGSPLSISHTEHLSPNNMRSWKSTSQPGSAIVANQMLKTKLCIDHHTKGCARGTKCPYAHSVAEMRTLPDLQKTKICSLVLAGKECKNKNCKYAHSDEELRYTCQFSEFRTRVCRFAKEQGGRGCLYGDRCPYAHSPEEMRMLKTPTIPQTDILIHNKKLISGAMHCDKDAPGRKIKSQQCAMESICHTVKPAKCATRITAHDLSLNHLTDGVCTKMSVKDVGDVTKFSIPCASSLTAMRNFGNTSIKNRDLAALKSKLHDELQDMVKFELPLPNSDEFSKQMIFERQPNALEPNCSMPISLTNVKRASTTGVVQMQGSISPFSCPRLQIDVSAEDEVLQQLGDSFASSINCTASVPEAPSKSLEKPTHFAIPNKEFLPIHTGRHCLQPVNALRRRPHKAADASGNDLPKSFATPVKCASYAHGNSLTTHKLRKPCDNQLPTSLPFHQETLPSFSTPSEFGKYHYSTPYTATEEAIYQKARNAVHSDQTPSLHRDYNAPITHCNMYSSETTLPFHTFDHLIDSNMQHSLMKNSYDNMATDQLTTSESQALRDCLLDLLQSEITLWGCENGGEDSRETSKYSSIMNNEDISQFHPVQKFTGGKDLCGISDLGATMSDAYQDGCTPVIFTALMRMLNQSVAQQVDNTQKSYLG